MKKTQAEALYPLTRAVRSLFHKLGAAVTALHEDTGISGGMRAVLESLDADGPRTVPELARSRPVSRQHIQVLVNDLLEQGYVAYQDNPAHKRSKLVRMTEEGRLTFAALRRRENEAFSRLPLDVAPDDLKAAERVLSGLVESFQGAEWRSIVTDLSTRKTE